MASVEEEATGATLPLVGSSAEDDANSRLCENDWVNRYCIGLFLCCLCAALMA